MRYAFLVAAGLVAVLRLSAADTRPAGPYPDPWRWVPEARPPVLTLDLGVAAFKQTLILPPGPQELRLVLNKYLMTEDGVTLEWTSDGRTWFWRQKKIPGESSTELVPLPPGKRLTLQVRTRSGVGLADLTLLRK